MTDERPTTEAPATEPEAAEPVTTEPVTTELPTTEVAADGDPAVPAPVPADPPATAVEPPTPSDGGDVELLGLIDRLASLLDRSDLTELEVEAGATGLILRKPSALASSTIATGVATATAPAADADAGGTTTAGEPAATGRTPAVPERPSVKAPLTGIFYASPAPGSAPYLQVGGEVAVGQVIGLIEAMKLFNEIKSDLAGRVARVVPESGTLVKAKQPLIEVDPL